MRFSTPSVTKKALGVAAGVVIVLGSAGGALAATGTIAGSGTIAGCITGSSRTLQDVHSPASGHRSAGDRIRVSPDATARVLSYAHHEIPGLREQG